MYLHISSYIFVCLQISSYIFKYLHISSYLFIYLHTSSYLFIYLQISSYIFIYFQISSYIFIYPQISSYMVISLYISSNIFIYLPIASYILIYLHISSYIFIFLHISHLHLFSLSFFFSLFFSLSSLSLFLPAAHQAFRWFGGPKLQRTPSEAEGEEETRTDRFHQASKGKSSWRSFKRQRKSSAELYRQLIHVSTALSQIIKSQSGDTWVKSCTNSKADEKAPQVRLYKSADFLCKGQSNKNNTNNNTHSLQPKSKLVCHDSKQTTDRTMKANLLYRLKLENLLWLLRQIFKNHLLAEL